MHACLIVLVDFTVIALHNRGMFKHMLPDDVIRHLRSRDENPVSTTQRPYITLSFGMSLDGKIATYTGDSKYISGSETRAFVHELRHRYDGILIGIQTVFIDHPSLTTRRMEGDNHDAHRIILDSHLSIDEAEPLLTQISNAKTILVIKKGCNDEKQARLQKQGVVFIEDSTPSSRIDLFTLLPLLKAFGIHRLFVEGGGTVHFSFIQHGLFDDLYAQISPLILGGKDAKTPVEGQGFAFLKDATHVAFQEYFNIGRDIVVYAKNLAKES